MEIGFFQGLRHRKVGLVVRFGEPSKGLLLGAQVSDTTFPRKGARPSAGLLGSAGDDECVFG